MGLDGGCDLRLLGAVSATVRGGDLPLGSLKSRIVWTVLVYNANNVVPVSSIADAVWDGSPPDTYAANIQVYISGLRRLIANAGAAASLAIESKAGGYRLSVDDECIDLKRFRRMSATAEKLAAAAQSKQAADAFRTALGEWRGPALADLHGVRFADELAIALEEDRLRTFERRVDADLLCGRHADLVSELTARAADHPLREQLWAKLITALYRSGRQGEALSAYRRLRDRLNDELGLDPSPPLQRLEHQILRQQELYPEAVPTSDRRGSASRTIQGSVLWERQAYLMDGEGVRFELGPAGLRIGRLPENDVVVDDHRASRFHCAIILTPEGFVLDDLHSTNGTAVNGSRLSSSYLLRAGDEISVGHYRLSFHLEGTAVGSADSG